uniref:butyrophilin subfamily 3 member A1-like n=1 Tax=Epinephelus lanceolatus TaxID=310571 RepID=UPI0014478222|nr:butyrophilin subfamily 3 member A1-like [Epinephelus lanceolatus]
MHQSCRMLPQVAVPAHQSPLSTLSVLAVLLSIAHSGGGQSQLIGPPQPIVVTVGKDIILPCHLEPAVDVAAKTLEWTRPDLNPRFVFVRRAGQDFIDTKHPSYKGRTSLFTDKLKRGNISLKLSDVRPSDAGRYRCFIPDLKTDSFVELVVASDAVSLPILTLAGIDKATSGVVLQCESAGWYPEPEVLWLDGEGKLLSAGPTETVRGPDELYTVSSRVTVEKRHSNSFTCRVQQRNINQTRETYIYISDDFFQIQSSSAAPVVTGLAFSLAVCILLLFAVVCKGKLNKIKTKKSHRDETNTGERKNHLETNRTEDQFGTKKELKPLEGKRQKRSKHEEQQRREEAEREVQTLKEELETKRTEFESKLAEVQQQLQSLREELETKNRELEESKAALSKSLIWATGYKVWIETSTDLVWYGQQPWGTGEQLLVTIYSNTGELEVRRMLALLNSQSNLQAQQTHLVSQDSAMGNITVSDIDLKGSYVRLSNTSNKDQPFKGWELQIQVNDRKPIVYKFFSSFKLEAGNTVTIWSSDDPGRNNPPTDLVWQKQKSWGTGKELLITVYSNTGENAVAWRPRRKCAAINCQEQLENMQAQPYQWQPQFFALVDGGGGRSGVGETL